MNILTINLVLSTVVFYIAARLYLWPRFHQLSPPRDVLLPILLLHSFRHFGLMFLAPGATYAGVPWQFAYPAAAGDLVAALLAILAIPAVAADLRLAKPAVRASRAQQQSGGAARLLVGEPMFVDRHLKCTNSPPLASAVLGDDVLSGRQVSGHPMPFDYFQMPSARRTATSWPT